MMRRSEWRPLPRDPRSPMGWWWRVTRRSLLTLNVLAGTIGGPLIYAYATGWSSIFAYVLLAVGGSLFATWLALKRKDAPKGIDELAPFPAPVEAFPIEFTLSQGDVVTGVDQGIASFVEGWMHVEGLRASFSLRPLDTVRIGFSSRGFDRFDLPGGQRIELRPISPSTADRETFQETVRVWHRFPNYPVGEPTLPPDASHPSAAARPLSVLAVHLLFVVPTIAFFLLIGRWEATAQFLPILIVPTIFAFRSAIVALRDLGRIAAYRRRSLPSGDTPLAASER